MEREREKERLPFICTSRLSYSAVAVQDRRMNSPAFAALYSNDVKRGAFFAASGVSWNESVS